MKNGKFKRLTFCDGLTFLSLIGLTILTIAGCKKQDIHIINPDDKGYTTAIFTPEKTYGTVTNIDGNTYKTIVIGTQTWMAENLRTTHYLNGDSIPGVSNNLQWSYLYSGACCAINNTRNKDSIATFGLLYNWYATADIRKLAPAGWHIPTSEEWGILTQLERSIGKAGNKLKEKGTMHWKVDSTGTTNESGFTALPGGYRNIGGISSSLTTNGFWWQSNESNSSNANSILMVSGYGIAITMISSKNYGCAIRCIKNE